MDKINKQSWKVKQLEATQKQRFGLRKLSIGVASVLLGTTFLFGTMSVAHADSANAADPSTLDETNEPGGKLAAPGQTYVLGQTNSQSASAANKSATPAETAGGQDASAANKQSQPANGQGAQSADNDDQQATLTIGSGSINNGQPMSADELGESKIPSLTASTLTADQSTITESTSRVNLTWQVANYHAGDQFELQFPKGIWVNQAHMVPIANATIDSSTISGLQENGNSIKVTMSSDNQESITVPIDLSCRVLNKAAETAGDFPYTIQVLHNGTLLTQLTLTESVTQPTIVIKQFDNNNLEVTPKGSNATINYSVNSSYASRNDVKLTNLKWTIHVPQYFKLNVEDTKAGLSTLSLNNVEVTQSQPGGVVTITADDGIIPGNSDFSMLELRGSYTDFSQPAEDQHDTLLDGSFSARFDNQTVTSVVPGYDEIILANHPEVIHPGHDLSYGIRLVNSLFLHSKQLDKYLGDSSFDSNMSADEHNLEHLSKYHDLTVTRTISDGYVVTKLTGFDSRVKTVTITYADGSQEQVDVKDQQVKLTHNKAVRQVSYDLTSLPQDFKDDVSFYGHLAPKYASGQTVKAGDKVTFGLSVKQADEPSLVESSKDTYIVDYYKTLLKMGFQQSITDAGARDAVSLPIWDKILNYTGSDYSNLRAQEIKNPQVWMVLPKTVAGADLANGFDATKWQLTTTQVGPRIVLHFKHQGSVKIDQFNDLLNSLPQSYNLSQFYPNQTDTGQVYFTADNLDQMDLTNSAATAAEAAALPEVGHQQLAKIGSFDVRTIAAAVNYSKVMATGNLDGGLVQAGQSTYHGSPELKFTAVIGNSTSNIQNQPVFVFNIPQTDSSQAFSGNLKAGSVKLYDLNTGALVSNAQILGSTTAIDPNSDTPVPTSGFRDLQQLNLKNVKALMVTTDQVAANDGLRLCFSLLPNTQDQSLIPVIGKTITVEGQTYTNNNRLPIKLTGTNAASIKVIGTLTVHSRLHYVDDQGHDHYVALSDQQGTIGQSAATLLIPETDSRITSKIPDGYRYERHTVINGKKTWLGNEPNGELQLNGQVTYDADDDTIQYELVQTEKENLTVKVVDYTSGQPNVVQTFEMTGRGNTPIQDDDVKKVTDYVKDHHYLVMDPNSITDSWLSDNNLSSWTLLDHNDAYSDDDLLSHFRYPVGSASVLAIPVNKHQTTVVDNPIAMNLNAKVAVLPANSQVKPLSQLSSQWSDHLSAEQMDFSNLVIMANSNLMTVLRALLVRVSVVTDSTGQVTYQLQDGPSSQFSQYLPYLRQYGLHLDKSQDGSMLTLTWDLSKLGYYQAADPDGKVMQLVPGTNWQNYDGLNGALRSKFIKPTVTMKIDLAKWIDANQRFAKSSDYNTQIAPGTISVDDQDIGAITVNQLLNSPQPAVQLNWYYDQDPEQCTITYRYVDALNGYQPVPNIKSVTVSGMAGDVKDVNMPAIPHGYQLVINQSTGEPLVAVPTTVTLERSGIVDIPLTHILKNDPQDGTVDRQYRVIELMPDGSQKIVSTTKVRYHGKLVTDTVTNKRVLDPNTTPTSVDQIEVDPQTTSVNVNSGVQTEIGFGSSNQVNGYPVTLVPPVDWQIAQDASTDPNVKNYVDYGLGNQIAFGPMSTDSDGHAVWGLGLYLTPLTPSQDFYLKTHAQKVEVKYIDDKTGDTLSTKDLYGNDDTAVPYDPADQIKSYEDHHYVLVSNNYPANLMFDHDDKADQAYEIHFKHDTKTDKQDVQVSRTIHYVYQDGHTVQPDHTDSLTFHETKTTDLVTGQATDDWTPAQDFATITSPSIAGYTPDHSTIENKNIAHDHDAIVETVTYSPDKQKAVVKYIDDTTGQQLAVKKLTGDSDQSTEYNTQATINAYKNQHYVLVSDDTDGKTIVFDHDDVVDQDYEVHFKHDTKTDEQDVQVPRTIHYVYQNGHTAQPDHTDNLTFHETKTTDLVTTQATDEWTPAQDFATIASPSIAGYTPDHSAVENKNIAHDHAAIVETVTYSPDAQKLTIDFIDDTTGQTLKTVSKKGVSDEDAHYSTASDINDFESQHYELVSDSTDGKDLVFDHDDAADQSYEVHLKHGTQTDTNEVQVSRTIHYVYQNGHTAQPDHTDSLTFHETKTTDLVTGQATDDWTPAQDFATIISPSIAGYTPDHSAVENKNIAHDHAAIVETVIYSPDAQKLIVNFIDDTTGQTIKTVNKTGYSDEDSNYNTASDINHFKNQHYELVSDPTNGKDLVFDHDDAVDQHYEVHLKSTKPAQPQPTEPSQPTSQPTEPSQPTSQPTEPSQPTSQPTEPSQPTSQPTEPSQPTSQPTEPSQPTSQPTEPSQPTSQPTEPSQPTSQPTEPSQPTSQPTEPSQPTSQPTEPSQPTSQPTEPSQPTSQPTEPSQPTSQPTEPSQPTSQPTAPQPTEPQPTAPGQLNLTPQGTPLNTADKIINLNGQSEKAASANSQQELPQTGTQSTGSMLGLGMASMVALLSFLGFGKKRKEE